MAKVNDSGSNYESGKPYSTSEAELEQWAQSLTEAVLVDRVDRADTTQLVNLINDLNHMTVLISLKLHMTLSQVL